MTDYRNSIAKEEIALLPPIAFEGEIIRVETLEGVKRAVDILSKEKVVGFDTESRPAFTKGESYDPSLIQLATNDQVFLFRLIFYKPPRELIDFLANPNVLKAGVGIHDDLLALKRIITFEPDGFVDLSKEARRRGMETFSLRGLTAIFLNHRLSKGTGVTNWERQELTNAQIKYAATDAWVGLKIYEGMFPS